MRSAKAGLFKTLVASSVLAWSAVGFAADGWQLDKDENDVQLYTKYSDKSQLKQVKVVTEVQSSLSALVSFLSDSSAFPEWMEKVSKVETLKDISPQESLTYTVIDSPWPEKDRDNVWYSKWEQNPDTFVVTKKVFAEPQFVKEQDGKIRSPMIDAQWVLTPKADGKVEVAYTSDYEPGGDVQGWLLDLFTYEMPYKTMMNLKQASFGKHQNASFAFIKEPGRKDIVMTQ